MKAMKSELELALEECSTCVEEGKPASTGLSDVGFGWEWRGRFLLKKE